VTALELLLSKYRTLEGNRLNMVIDANAQTSGKDGSSRSLSHAADKELLKHLRSISGLIITDAATAAAEQYRPSKFAPIQIWSKTANFRGFRDIPAEAGLQALTVKHTDDLDLAVAEASLLTRRLLFETGPTVSALLAKANLIDELCLTVTGFSNESEAGALALQFAKKLGLGQMNIFEPTKLEDSYFFVLR
jgi:riboflavin biosynthesis pyrimidine reductase